jgi:hypothetical protein
MSYASLLSDVPRVLHLNHSLASSADGTPVIDDVNAVAPESGGDANRATHGVLNVVYARTHNGRDDEVPMHQRVSLVLSRGQIESLTAQLHRMLERVSGTVADGVAQEE